MKKQIKKLNLNKRTISNLNVPEMNRHVGGVKTNGTNCQTNGNNCTHTCYYCPPHTYSCQVCTG